MIFENKKYLKSAPEKMRRKDQSFLSMHFESIGFYISNKVMLEQA